MSAQLPTHDPRTSPRFRLVAWGAVMALLFSFGRARGDDQRPATLESPQPAAVKKVAPNAHPVTIEQVPVATPRTVTFDDGWVMQITPNPTSTTRINGVTYESVYNSIPYSRTEYLANPSYRHDTTVELLFGQMRPTVVHRTVRSQVVVNPRPAMTQPYLMSRSDLWAVPWWSAPGLSSLIPYTPFPPILGAIRYPY